MTTIRREQRDNAERYGDDFEVTKADTLAHYVGMARATAALNSGELIPLDRSGD